MLVGVHGYKGAGKDAFFARAQLAFPELQLDNLKFADKLYDSAAAALGVDRAWLESEKNEKWSGIAIIEGGRQVGNLTVRRFLEQYGDEAHRRVFGLDFWLDHLLPVGYDVRQSNAVVTDMRYPNEIDAVRELGGVLVKVVDPAVKVNENHPSRQVIPDGEFDVVVVNDRVRGWSAIDSALPDVFASRAL